METPADSSSSLTAPALPDTRVELGKASALTGFVNYCLNDQLSFSIPLGLCVKHKISGAGNLLIAGLGKFSDVKVMPVTVLAQYSTGDIGGLRLFVGSGLN